ncbi:MAG: hypothetical protein KatS3mg076_1957 [Candidatus Binatia bacterium]|nr:MAG: hypothetical protein KatS3mg076_1957 [Candidatus Binatia bacterium]
MGVFRVACEIVNPRQPRRTVRIPAALVDSGSEFTWIPAEALARIGIPVAKKDQAFVLANGQVVTRPVGYAIIRAAGFETVDEVVFAEPGDLTLLGARTLDGFGARVDAHKRRLVASGPHLAAGPHRE